MSNTREVAREIAKRYTREGTGYADRLYQLAYAIEQALRQQEQEVRAEERELTGQLAAFIRLLREDFDAVYSHVAALNLKQTADSLLADYDAIRRDDTTQEGEQ